MTLKTWLIFYRFTISQNGRNREQKITTRKVSAKPIKQAEMYNILSRQYPGQKVLILEYSCTEDIFG